jgi:hypothetical protein
MPCVPAFLVREPAERTKRPAIGNKVRHSFVGFGERLRSGSNLGCAISITWTITSS